MWKNTNLCSHLVLNKVSWPQDERRPSRAVVNWWWVIYVQLSSKAASMEETHPINCSMAPMSRSVRHQYFLFIRNNRTTYSHNGDLRGEFGRVAMAEKACCWESWEVVTQSISLHPLVCILVHFLITLPPVTHKLTMFHHRSTHTWTLKEDVTNDCSLPSNLNLWKSHNPQNILTSIWRLHVEGPFEGDGIDLSGDSGSINKQQASGFKAEETHLYFTSGHLRWDVALDIELVLLLCETK